jgi:uncharacterized protein YbjQ (UPF0145 family)
MNVIVVNTDFVPGKEIVEALGLAKGNVIQAKHIGKDIAAGFRLIVGGEIRVHRDDERGEGNRIEKNGR